MHVLDKAVNPRMLAALGESISKRRLAFGAARSSLTQRQGVN